LLHSRKIDQIKLYPLFILSEEMDGLIDFLFVRNSPRSRCRIRVPIECLLKTKFLILFMINRMYIYQGAYQNVAANILN